MRRHRPPWWPANEPWPPADRQHYWNRGRRWFVWRIAILFGTMLVLSAIGVTTVASIVMSWLSGTTTPAFGWRHSIGAAIVPLMVLFALFLIATFFRGMRRVGSPLVDIVSAADRLASGD